MSSEEGTEPLGGVTSWVLQRKGEGKDWKPSLDEGGITDLRAWGPGWQRGQLQCGQEVEKSLWSSGHTYLVPGMPGGWQPVQIGTSEGPEKDP